MNQYSCVDKIPFEDENFFRIRTYQIIYLRLEKNYTTKEIAEITDLNYRSIPAYISNYQNLLNKAKEYFKNDANLPKHADPQKRLIPMTKIVPDFIDENDIEMFPSTCGLYLIGNTVFNPITKEEYYWIKCGLSKNLHRRMKDYGTHNPMLFYIDYKECSSDEVEYKESYIHFELSKIATHMARYASEWYLVSKEDYLKICENGFNFFESC